MRVADARTPAAEPVAVERVADGVLRVRMQDDASCNGLSAALVDRLVAALRTAHADDDVRVVLLCGGAEYFCTGATPVLLAALGDGRTRPTELDLTRHLLTLAVPVIAACAGAAIGGGFVLATACDIVLLARDRRYGFNFLDLGITPGMGATALAEHALGAARAHELLYSGEFRTGAQLASCPGVAAVASAHEVEALALDLAFRIAGKSRRNLSLLKRTLTLPRRRRLEEALTLESVLHETSLGGLDRAALEAVS